MKADSTRIQTEFHEAARYERDALVPQDQRDHASTGPGRAQATRLATLPLRLAGLATMFATALSAWALPAPLPLKNITYLSAANELGDPQLSAKDTTTQGVATTFNDRFGNGHTRVRATVSPAPDVAAYVTAFVEKRGGGVGARAVASMTYQARLGVLAPAPTTVTMVPVGMRASFEGTASSGAGASASFVVGLLGGTMGQTLAQDTFSTSDRRPRNRTYVSLVPPNSIGVIQKSVECIAKAFWDPSADAAPPPGICAAGLDPILYLDQAEFDRRMGDQTFPLADYFQLQFSPGILNQATVPEPISATLFGAGLACLVLIRQRRRRVEGRAAG